MDGAELLELWDELRLAGHIMEIDGVRVGFRIGEIVVVVRELVGGRRRPRWIAARYCGAELEGARRVVEERVRFL